MRKKFLVPSILAGIIAAAAIGVSLYTPALAKNQAQPPTPAERMAIYSAPKDKNNKKAVVRQSRVSQQNIVGEAAEALNVLPIDIINEMKKGKTLAQVAKDKGLTEAEFNKKLSALDKKITDAALKDGSITKEHADAINSGRTERIKNGMKEKAMKAGTVMDMGN